MTLQRLLMIFVFLAMAATTTATQMIYHEKKGCAHTQAMRLKFVGSSGSRRITLQDCAQACEDEPQCAAASYSCGSGCFLVKVPCLYILDKTNSPWCGGDFDHVLVKQLVSTTAAAGGSTTAAAGGSTRLLSCHPKPEPYLIIC